jgi:hypothetical protein
MRMNSFGQVLLMKAVMVGCLLLCVGCTTPIVPLPAANVDPDGHTSVVVGRIQISHNGARLPPGHMFYKFLNSPAKIDVRFSIYNGIQSLAPLRSEYGGEWSITVPWEEGGSYAVTLPPGTYYIYQLGYHGFFRYPYYVQTYAKAKRDPPNDSYVFKFNVLPGRTNYLGTLLVDFKDDPEYPGWYFGISHGVTDESEDMRKEIAQKYPKWADVFETHLFETVGIRWR